MKGLVLSCNHCGQEHEPIPFTADAVQRLAAAYMAHLVESHWDLLELGRRERLATGRPINDAWTRI